MKKHTAAPPRQQRRISAALRLLLVAVLLLLQIALVVLLSLTLKQRMALAYTALELAALICAIRIYNRTGNSHYRFGWILLILVTPVVGMTLYYLWMGYRPDKKLGLQKQPRPQESDSRAEQSRLYIERLRSRYPVWGRLASYLDRQGFPLLGRTEADYFSSGEDFWTDVIVHLEQAEHFIFLEFFIVAEGELWDRVSQILQRKAESGLEVKLLYDDFGSMMRLKSESVEQLRRSGVEVICFNPVHHSVNRLYFNYRNHRKSVCIDGDIGYACGANLADEYANLIERYGHWKDCGARMDGEGAWGLCREFLHLWTQLGGEIRQDEDYYRPRLHRETIGYCQTVVDGPDNNPSNALEDVYLQLISGARRMLYITTPYLAIDDSMCKALSLAGDCGVDVRLMLPGVPDHKAAYLVAESYFAELMAHGVKIYLYSPGLLHGKSVLVDREVGFVGSVNMDYRSFQLNFECGTVFYDMPMLEDLLEDMDQIADKSRLLSPETWRWPWYRRIFGTVFRLFAVWM